MRKAFFYDNDDGDDVVKETEVFPFKPVYQDYKKNSNLLSFIEIDKMSGLEALPRLMSPGTWKKNHLIEFGYGRDKDPSSPHKAPQHLVKSGCLGANPIKLCFSSFSDFRC